VGLCYAAVLPDAQAVSALPSPAKAAYTAVCAAQRTQSRGDIRGRNDQTFESRAANFACWMAKVGFHDQSITMLSPGQAVPLLAAYLLAVAVEGVAINGRPGLVHKSLVGYLNAAHQWLQYVMGQPLSIGNSASLDALHPLLADTIQFRRTWAKPREKREPFTSAMFETLFTQISMAAKVDFTAYLGRKAAVFDWVLLGVFMGSRGN